MTTMASQLTSLTVVYSIVYSGADQRKHQSSASLAFVWGIHRWPLNSSHKGPVTRKMFPFDDVIMSCWNLTKTIKSKFELRKEQANYIEFVMSVTEIFLHRPSYLNDSNQYKSSRLWHLWLALVAGWHWEAYLIKTPKRNKRTWQSWRYYMLHISFNNNLGCRWHGTVCNLGPVSI